MLCVRMRVWKRQEGTVTLEMAFVAPVLILLIMGMLELGIVYFIQSTLEGANVVGSGINSLAAIRGVSRADYIRQIAVERSGGFLDPEEIVIDVSALDMGGPGGAEPCITVLCGGGDPGHDYIDINGNRMWDEELSASPDGKPKDIIIYTVTYPWQVVTPLLWPFRDEEGDIRVTSIAMTRNRSQ